MAEQWREIRNYNGYYVSDKGNVKSERKMLATHTMKNGYKAVSLGVGKERKAHLVHRLVANAFIDNQNILPEVNHKDENKENNCASNLEWCSRLYNVHYGTGTQRAVKSKSKPIVQKTLDGKIIKVWSSTQEAGRNGFNQARITYCAHKKPRYKTYKNCIWEYLIMEVT